MTRSAVFLHFDTDSESTETADSLSKVETKSKFKFLNSLIDSHLQYFLYRGMFIGDEGEMKMKEFTFSPHLKRAEMSFDLIGIQPSSATFK